MKYQWYVWKYGFNFSEWCVLEETAKKVKVGKKDWLVSSAMWVEKDYFFQTAEFLCKGRRSYNPLKYIFFDLSFPFAKV